VNAKKENVVTNLKSATVKTANADQWVQKANPDVTVKTVATDNTDAHQAFASFANKSAKCAVVANTKNVAVKAAEQTSPFNAGICTYHPRIEFPNASGQ